MIPVDDLGFPMSPPPLLPDAYDRVTATLPPAPEAAPNPPVQVLHDTSRFMRDMAVLQRTCWPHPAHLTAVRLAGVLAALERPDATGQMSGVDAELTRLLKIVRGQ